MNLLLAIAMQKAREILTRYDLPIPPCAEHHDNCSADGLWGGVCRHHAIGRIQTFDTTGVYAPSNEVSAIINNARMEWLDAKGIEHKGVIWIRRETTSPYTEDRWHFAYKEVSEYTGFITRHAYSPWAIRSAIEKHCNVTLPDEEWDNAITQMEVESNMILASISDILERMPTYATDEEGVYQICKTLRDSNALVHQYEQVWILF
jgi:hypothetical protein